MKLKRKLLIMIIGLSEESIENITISDSNFVPILINLLSITRYRI